ncbi:hypothetical protein [Streptomyces sp. NPDC001480]|uniref:hypothetical protein n=1 Tax=Streptomyces sp. NPDC001480 TaxID=3364577 RepID=UPI00368D4108
MDENQAQQGVQGELVASMEDSTDRTFGARRSALTLSEASDQGIAARRSSAETPMGLFTAGGLRYSGHG